MVAYNKINQFTEDLGKKVHDLSLDALTFALTTMALKPTAASTQLSGLTQITYTGLTGNGTGTGGRAPAITSYTQTSGTAKLILVDLVLTASATVAAFGAVTLYNDTSTNKKLIAWWEYGSDVTMLNTETFTLDFDPSAGVLTIL